MQPKRLARLFSTVALCSIVASCSVVAAGKVNIKFSTWGSAEEVLLNKEIIKRFEAKHPDIKVSLIYIDGGQYFTRLLTQMASGAGPDVMYINPQWSFPLYKMGAILNLEPYFTRDKELLDPKVFETKAYSGFLYGGKHYGTTNGTNIISVAYNKDLVAKAGLVDPPNDWTYTDFVEYAKKMTVFSGTKPQQMGLEPISNWYGTIFPLLWAFGGDLFDEPTNPKKCIITSPESVQGLQFLYDLYYRYRVCPSAEVSSPGGWANGKLAMTFFGTWGTEQLKKVKNLKWDLAPLPRAKTQVTPFFLGGYVVSRTTKHKNQAWEFARFYQSQEAQELIGRDGLITPMRRSVAESDLFLKLPGAPSRHRIRLDAFKSARLADPFHVRFPKIVDEVVYPNLSKMTAKKQSVEDTAKKIEIEVNKLLKTK